MSTTRGFTPITGAGSGGAFNAGSKWGYQTAEEVRQALDIALYLPHIDLGGDETGVLTGAATWAPVRGYREITLNGDSLGSLTIEAVVWSYTSNAATAVQLRLRNITDSSNACTSASHSGTTATKETVTATLASGVKVYRLEMLGDGTNEVLGWGYLRLRTTPA